MSHTLLLQEQDQLHKEKGDLEARVGSLQCELALDFERRRMLMADAEAMVEQSAGLRLCDVHTQRLCGRIALSCQLPQSYGTRLRG